MCLNSQTGTEIIVCDFVLHYLSQLIIQKRCNVIKLCKSPCHVLFIYLRTSEQLIEKIMSYVFVTQ